jgi:aryl-alcohol dehydrogenase-like predicted oxidoreductase
MHYKTLGDTGLLVSTLCFGTMTFGGSQGMWKTIGQVDQPGADELIKASIDAGINFFDTADVYSDGQSEITLGQSFKNLGVARKDVVIATKVYGRTGPGRNDVGASRGHIMDAVEASLKRLNTDHIDLYQIHGNDIITPVEETLRALDTLVQHGKIRYIGCSNWLAWKIMKALGISEHKGLAKFDTLQAYYSIAGRDLERDIVPLLEAEKIGLLVWSPLAGGLLSGKFSREGDGPEGTRRASFDFPPVDKDRAFRVVDVMRSIAGEKGTTVPRVALSWILHQKFVSTVIIGAKSEEQLRDNLGATEVALSTEELARLDEVSALPPEYPGWMIARQSSERVGK